MDQDITDEQVDQIITDAYSGKSDGAAESISTQPEPVQEASRTYELNWKGQKITADEDKLKTWAQLGYDYSQNMNQFKQEKNKWENDLAPYREIDTYAKSNPTWWDYVRQQYEQREAPGHQTFGSDDALSEVSPELKQYMEPIVKDYSQIKSFINDYQREKIEQKTREEDQALDREISSIKERYKTLDFSAKDESGQSLEQRVIEHGVRMNMPNFRSAFHDYYHDELEKLAERRGKESLSQEAAKRKKLGIVDVSQSPFAPSNEPYSVRGKSWNDVHQDALRDLNLA